MQNRVNWIDAAKGIATILVVSGHVWGGYTGKFGIPEYQNLIDYVVYIIYTFHMALFFILSGYVYALSERVVSSGNNYRTLVERKAKALMIPYYVAGIITILIKIPFAGSITYGYSWSNILLLPIKPVEQLWFIYVLFLCFCVKGFCEWKNKDGIAVPIMMFIVGTAFSIYANSSINSWGTLLSSLLSYYFYFYVGYMIRKNRFYISTKVSVIAFVLFIVLSTWIYCVNLYVIVVRLIRLILALTGSAIVLYSCTKIKTISGCKWLGRLGKYSMIIYLIHPLFCSMIRRGLYMVGINNFTIHIIMATVLSLIVPILIEITYKKIVEKVMN